MAGAREGYDLLHPYGRRHFWRDLLARNLSWSLVRLDTWSGIVERLWCSWRGHDPKPRPDWPGEHNPDHICRRCNCFVEPVEPR